MSLGLAVLDEFGVGWGEGWDEWMSGWGLRGVDGERVREMQWEEKRKMGYLLFVF